MDEQGGRGVGDATGMLPGVVGATEVLPGIDAGAGLPAVFLPPVVHEASSAVLVVDLSRGEVTYANDLARALVPDHDLPLSVDEWSTAAGLEDVTGLELPDSEDDEPPRGSPAESLLRVAQGQPVTGEAVTAARGTAVTRPREVLWVLGLPMTGAPEPISSLALVVFLPARNARLVAGVQEAATSLRDRAVLATRMSFTITDPSRPDNPLVWVNPAFTATTGYEYDEAVGHNCRFLQGPTTDRRVVREIRQALEDERSVTTTLLNRRKDGTPFWNELSISPIRDRDGVLTHFVGVQADVTARVQAQLTRDEALSKVARAADRLALLADFTSRMAMSRVPQQLLTLLSDVLIPRVGGLAVTVLFDEHGRAARPVIVHERGDDPEIAAAAESLADRLVSEIADEGPISRVLAGELDYAVVRDLAVAENGEPVDALRELLTAGLGMASMAVVPLLARHGILGAVVLAGGPDRPPLGEDELALLRDLSARAGLMLENTQLYTREQQAAATLQRSLLPRLPELPGMRIAARYVPSSDQAAVGGDWYDVFPLREGGVGVVVGDVMGHNYASAARMGKLSTIVRSYGFPGSEPHVVLTAVDELLSGSEGSLDILATCLLGTLVRTEAGIRLRYSSAGHPPALLRLPNGSVRYVEGGRGPMIGIAELSSQRVRPPDAVLDLELGTTMICFTDGLVDSYSADGDIDVGLAELARLTEQQPVDATPEALVDALTARASGAVDDVAIVAICIHG